MIFLWHDEENEQKPKGKQLRPKSRNRENILKSRKVLFVCFCFFLFGHFLTTISKTCPVKLREMTCANTHAHTGGQAPARLSLWSSGESEAREQETTQQTSMRG